MKRTCLVNRLKANKMKKISLLLVLLAFVIAGCVFNASAGKSPADGSAPYAAAGGEEMKPGKNLRQNYMIMRLHKNLCSCCR